MAPRLFEDVYDELTAGASSVHDLARPFVEVFPVAGSSVATVGSLLGSETVSASSSEAARIDELQFDLGEGPCWDAMRSARPVLEPDLRSAPTRFWPAFTDAILGHPVASLFAFPLRVGPLQIGAIDMYSTEPSDLDDEQSRQASAMAEIVSRQILRNALLSVGDAYSEDAGNPFSRRIIHQATGMVLAQLGVSAEDATLVIQGHAFATGVTMMSVAESVLDGRLDFSMTNAGIEGSNDAD